MFPPEEIHSPWQEEHNLQINLKINKNNIKILLIQDKCGKLKMNKETIQLKIEDKIEMFQ